MALANRIEKYQTKTWKTYEIVIGSSEEPPSKRDFELHNFCCHSESEMAEKLGENPKRFYVDWEMVAADIDPKWGVIFLGRLTQDWRGHKAGNLAMSLPLGVGESPATFTWMIEV